MAKRRTKRRKVSEQIREIIQNCGISRYEIAKRTGIDQSALARFMNGERGVSSKALDTLGDLLDLEIVQGTKQS